MNVKKLTGIALATAAAGMFAMAAAPGRFRLTAPWA